MFSRVDIAPVFKEIRKAQPLDLGRIGASDTSAIMGMNPWQTKEDVISRILTVRAGKKPKDITSSPAYWGTVIEPLVIATLSAAWGTDIHKPPSLVGPKGRAWQRVSPDGLIQCENRGGGLEIKNVSWSRWEEDWGNGTHIPPYYVTQLQTLMEAFDAEWWWMAALVGGQYLYTTCVLADPEMQAEIITECEKTWRQMLAREALEAA